MKRILAWLLFVGMVINLWAVTPAFQVKAADNSEEEECKELVQRFYDSLVYPETSDPETLNQVADLDRSVDTYLSRRLTGTTRTGIFSDSKISSPGDSNELANGTTSRMVKMAKAYCSPNSKYYKNAELLSDLQEDLEWIYINLYNPDKFNYYYPEYNKPSSMRGNWWAWECGVAGNLSNIYVMLENELDPQRLEKYLITCDVFVPTPFYAACGNPTGANAVWITDTVLKVAALRGNPPYTGKPANYPTNSWREPQLGLSGFTNKLDACKKKVNDMLVITDSKDGFYWDGSYLGHEAHAYSGGYGASYYNDTLSYIKKLIGTKYGPEKESIQVLTKWTYDAIEPMIYDINFLQSTIGREVGRHPDEVSRVKSIMSGMLLYEEMTGMDYFQEYLPEGTRARTRSMIKQLAQRFIEVRGKDALLSGWSKDKIAQINGILEDESVIPRGENVQSRIFPVMGKMINYKENWGAAVSYYDTSLRSHEDGAENKKGWHWNNGMVYLYNHDPDLFSGNYFATVDVWKHSGTTVVEDSTVPGAGAGSGPYGGSFGGGTAMDRSYTALAYNLKPQSRVGGVDTNLNANKSYFGFDNELVCLGSNISATTADKSVWTTFENRKVTGHDNKKFIVDGKEPIPNLGDTATVEDASWAYYEGPDEDANIGYYFPQKETIALKRESRTGLWSEVSTGDTTPAVTDSYITMYKDHGKKPTEGTYQYVILPDKSPEEVKAYSEDPQVEVIAFTPNVHAVHQKELDIYAANFYAAGQEKAGPIWSDGISSVIVKKDGPTTSITVADPTKKATFLHFTIDCKAGSVVSADPEIQVTQMGSRLGFTLNAKGSQGKTYEIKVSETPADYTGQKNLETFSNGQFVGTVTSSNNAGTAKVVAAPENSYNQVLKISQKANQAKTYTFDFNSGYPADWQEATGGASFDPAVTHSGTEGGSIKLVGRGSAKYSFPDDNYIIEVWIYDANPSLPAGAFISVADSMMGIYTQHAGDEYMCGKYQNYTKSGVKRSQGWHKFTIDASDKENVKQYIDGEEVYTSKTTAITQLELGDWWNLNTNPVYFDDLSIRTNSTVESNVVVEQALPYFADTISYGANIRTDYVGEEEVDVFNIAGNADETALRVAVKQGKLYAYVGDYKETPLELAGYEPGKWLSLGAYINGKDSTVTLYVNGKKELDAAPTYEPVTGCGALSHKIGNLDMDLYVDNVLIVPEAHDHFSSAVSEDYDFGRNKANYSQYGPAYAQIEAFAPGDNILQLSYQDNVLVEDFEGDLAQWGKNPAQPNRIMPDISGEEAHSGEKSLQFTKVSEAMSFFDEGNYIVEAYLKRPSSSDRSTGILSAQLSGGAGTAGAIEFGINHLQWSNTHYAYRFGGKVTVTDIPIKPDQWVKLTMDFSSGEEVRLLIDDVEVFKGTGTGLPLSINRLDLGNWWTDNGGPVYMDDVTIRKNISSGATGIVAFDNKTFVPGFGKSYFEVQVSVADCAKKTEPYIISDLYGNDVLNVFFENGEIKVQDKIIGKAENGAWYTLGAMVDPNLSTAALYIDHEKVAVVPIENGYGAYLTARTSPEGSVFVLDNIRLGNHLSGDMALKPQENAWFFPALYDAASGKALTSLPEADTQVYCQAVVGAEQKDTTFYVASYGAENKLISVSVVKAQRIEENGTVRLRTESFALGKGVKSVKAFLLREGTMLQPQSHPMLIE